ncbi:hypothetical protein ATANTOWER_018199 [Ataeniobius toweri]|uniref:Ig-like domain-containing protein n=1 Tax=Ataeniobius toweri TaxID=208326 RepID=A0ABU7AHX2_9TELE|nr:hypothetical protein [Ataeniobius toweri]
MLSLLTSGFILLVLLIGTGVNCQQLTALKTEESSLEGGSVTLSCNYTKSSANYLFWYRQNPGKPPEFLKSHSPSVTAEHLDRLKFEGSKEEMKMTISSAAVTDSAVYYCAVEPTVTGNTRTLYKNLQYSITSTRGPHTLFHLWFVRIQLRIKQTSECFCIIELCGDEKV